MSIEKWEFWGGIGQWGKPGGLVHLTEKRLIGVSTLRHLRHFTGQKIGKGGRRPDANLALGCRNSIPRAGVAHN
jgi:hypothetical protein